MSVENDRQNSRQNSKVIVNSDGEIFPGLQSDLPDSLISEHIEFADDDHTQPKRKNRESLHLIDEVVAFMIYHDRRPYLLSNKEKWNLSQKLDSAKHLLQSALEKESAYEVWKARGRAGYGRRWSNEVELFLDKDDKPIRVPSRLLAIVVTALLTHPDLHDEVGPKMMSMNVDNIYHRVRLLMVDDWKGKALIPLTEDGSAKLFIEKHSRDRSNNKYKNPYYSLGIRFANKTEAAFEEQYKMNEREEKRSEFQEYFRPGDFLVQIQKAIKGYFHNHFPSSGHGPIHIHLRSFGDLESSEVIEFFPFDQSEFSFMENDQDRKKGTFLCASYRAVLPDGRVFPNKIFFGFESINKRKDSSVRLTLEMSEEFLLAMTFIRNQNLQRLVAEHLVANLSEVNDALQRITMAQVEEFGEELFDRSEILDEIGRQMAEKLGRA